MSTQQTIRRISGGVPFELDVLEADLESKFPGFAAGLPVNWGLAVGAVPGSWDKVAQIAGMDWSAGFYPPKEFRVPLPRRSPSGRVVWRRVPTHCVVLSVTTGETDTNAARDRGRPAVRALLALMRREVPTIVPSDALWEGAVVWPGKGRVRMTGAALAVESATPASPSRLHKMGLKLAKVSVASFPPQLQQALQWLNLARSASVRPEKFIHLWLAVLTLASYGQPKKLSDMSRIRRYTNTMTLGIGGVRSPLSVAELNERLRKVYKIRNDLLHRAVDSQITLALLEQLESDAFELVDFELAKLGTSISAA